VHNCTLVSLLVLYASTYIKGLAMAIIIDQSLQSVFNCKNAMSFVYEKSKTAKAYKNGN
jgi:hypothetical protein